MIDKLLTVANPIPVRSLLKTKEGIVPELSQETYKTIWARITKAFSGIQKHFFYRRIPYEDDRRLFEYKKMDEHVSGGASPGYWLLTQDAIYVGNYDHLLFSYIPDSHIHQTHICTDQIVSIQFHSNQIPKDHHNFPRISHPASKDDHLACADVQTLANAHEIRYAFDEESERSYEAAGNFIYQSYGALWRYDIGESDEVII